MKPQTKKIISISILLILAALLIYYINKNWESFASLKVVNPYLLIVMALVFLPTYLLIAILNNQLLKALGVRMGERKT